MNVWKLTAANNLVHTTEDLVPVEGRLKVRVTKVLVGVDDALIFNGTNRAKYPRILGRVAVGMVAEDLGEIKRGTRVLLHAALPEEDTGTGKPDYSQIGRSIAGYTADGYLRDFVFADVENLTFLPDAVNDEKALFIHAVALAKAAIDMLDPQKGDHVAVIGADLMGLFVSQLLIYQQVSPTLIDERADRLEFARANGVYYTFRAEETLLDEISAVTGGRLCDGAIYTKSVKDSSLPFAVCAPQTTAVFSSSDSNTLQLPVKEIISKQISVYGVSDGTDYIETAINLIANKAVDLTPFHANIVNADDLPALFKEYLQNPERDVKEMNVVNLL